ncbi:leucine-rich repeat-containing protein 3B-like [Astyanax mexicanus]|uniref:Leucine-rich repeat-containing protein 3B-like n=1 Tax=Astyanax mexicanus TaxID=7994 RepID=A0A8T2KZH8_ASTMX|nr:leucine-rich repeat-containing protein 3B-like [Astyanax mexicanus]
MVQHPSALPGRRCQCPAMLHPVGFLFLRLVLPCLLLRVLGLGSGSRQLMSGCPESCYCSESWDGGLAVRCSNMNLLAVPRDLPNQTRRLYLDYNLLVSVPADSFLGLPLLAELDLSHNRLMQLEPGAFHGLADSLTSLDLSFNLLETMDPEALGELRAQANLTHNPWMCDCRLQVAMPQLQLEPSSLAGVVCNGSEPEDVGARGVPFVLVAADLDLCAALKRTTDVAMLVTMFGWFTMVISYLVYYVRHNREDARRHLEYLKSLPNKQGLTDEVSTLSTMV